MSSPASKPSCQLCGHAPLREFVVPQQTKFDVCPRCSLYQNGPCHEAELYDLEEYHASYEHHADRKLRTAIIRLNRIAPTVHGDNVRFLDVGCGTGSTLQAAELRGWEPVGVDISGRVARLCRERGFEAHAVDGRKLPFEDQSFDVLTAWSVIEHVPDIREALAEWRRVLKPGGVLAVDTSNARCLKARLLGARYRNFWPIGHTYTFTPWNLGQFLQQAGFTLVRQPLIGRWSDLGPSLTGYALAYQSFYELRRSLRLQKAFQLFARRTAAAPTSAKRAAA